jgi:hypothetical protein
MRVIDCHMNNIRIDLLMAKLDISGIRTIAILIRKRESYPRQGRNFIEGTVDVMQRENYTE